MSGFVHKMYTVVTMILESEIFAQTPQKYRIEFETTFPAENHYAVLHRATSSAFETVRLTKPVLTSHVESNDADEVSFLHLTVTMNDRDDPMGFESIEQNMWFLYNEIRNIHLSHSGEVGEFDQIEVIPF